jgi:hypothetical protein
MQPDPTPAEIDAGTKAFVAAALNSAGRWHGRTTSRGIVAAALRAVLPDHDARIRAEVAEAIAQAIEAQAHDPMGTSDPHEFARTARAHTSRGDT